MSENIGPIRPIGPIAPDHLRPVLGSRASRFPFVPAVIQA